MAEVSDAVTAELPAGRGRGNGTDARRTVARGGATATLAGPVMVSPTWKLLRSSRASAADPAKKPNTNAQRNMPRSGCAARSRLRHGCAETEHRRLEIERSAATRTASSKGRSSCVTAKGDRGAGQHVD